VNSGDNRPGGGRSARCGRGELVVSLAVKTSLLKGKRSNTGGPSRSSLAQPRRRGQRRDWFRRYSHKSRGDLTVSGGIEKRVYRNWQHEPSSPCPLTITVSGHLGGSSARRRGLSTAEADAVQCLARIRFGRRESICTERFAPLPSGVRARRRDATCRQCHTVKMNFSLLFDIGGSISIAHRSASCLISSRN
jgi:hypothetical protein